MPWWALRPLHPRFRLMESKTVVQLHDLNMSVGNPADMLRFKWIFRHLYTLTAQESKWRCRNLENRNRAMQNDCNGCFKTVKTSLMSCLHIISAADLHGLRRLFYAFFKKVISRSPYRPHSRAVMQIKSTGAADTAPVLLSVISLYIQTSGHTC